ncbi:F-box protein At2g02240 [Hevea brasiliensis]|uniref:F-box protein At2g02240 n=1 Tax=Hevea brasiliensis TaxID=3981 RepID=UPI0025DAA736|nr:F-box protein At2g02240 [Hevea brasiliensis]
MSKFPETEGCVAHVLSFTSPQEACRLSLISHTFNEAANSDIVWNSFLPADYQSIVSRSSDSSLLASRLPRKQMFLSLCDNPILIDDGKMSFALDKWTGKKCFMLSARDLKIIWGNTPEYWQWISEPDSRFTEVAELISVCWFEIRGKINTCMLSPATLYKAYLVFKLRRAYGFGGLPVEGIVGFAGSESSKRTIYLDNRTGSRREASVSNAENSENYPKKRGDGWLEIELGEFLNEEGDHGELEISVLEVKRLNWKHGLVVRGIEIRPKTEHK